MEGLKEVTILRVLDKKLKLDKARAYKTPKKQNSLLELLENCRLEIVQILLKNYAHIEEPTSLDETPLLLAAKNGFYEIGRLLLIHGASVNVKDYKELTPLHHAVISSIGES